MNAVVSGFTLNLSFDQIRSFSCQFSHGMLLNLIIFEVLHIMSFAFRDTSPGSVFHRCVSYRFAFIFMLTSEASMPPMLSEVSKV